VATDAATARGPYKTGVRRRAQIVAAASAVIARRGYAGASLRLIGEAVGMTPAGLLRHFDTKEDLLFAVLEDWRVQTSQLPSASSAPGLGHFAAYVDLMRYHMAHPGLIELFLTMCTEASDPAHPARDWVATRYETIVADGIEHLRYASEHGEIPPMSTETMEMEIRGLYAMMDGLELQWIANRSIDLAQLFESLFTVILLRWHTPSSLSQ
jgi:AcrR family transcriptional regulator